MSSTRNEQDTAYVCPYEGCSEVLGVTIVTTIDGPDHKGRVDICVNVEDVSDDGMKHFREVHHPDDHDAHGDPLPKAGISVWPGP